MKRAMLLVGLLLALSGAIAGTVHASDATPATTERLQALDDQILTRLNATRAAHGLRPLVASSELENAAATHSRELIQAGVFQHDSPDGTAFVQRLKHFYSPSGYASWTAGENILYNTAAIDAATAIRAWLDSPPHRENMLDPAWREVGIGSVHASAAGGTFGGEPAWVITMDFGARTGGARAATNAPVTLKAVAAHKKVTAKRTVKKTVKKAVTKPAKNKLKKAKKHAAAAHAKKPAAKPKKTPKAKPKQTPKAPGKIDRELPDPSSGGTFEPPLAGSAGDAPDAAVFGHRTDEDEDAAPGGEELAPVPPPAELVLPAPES